MIGFFAFMIVVILGSLVLLQGFQWLGDRRRPVDGVDRSAGRLDRMESALGALEARLDDLQEQQRFLERLLAERPQPGALPGPGDGHGGGGGEREGSGGGILFDTKSSEEEL